MDFNIQLQLEDGSLRKETNITCFIEGHRTSTEFKFRKMATSTLQTLPLTISIPTGISGSQIIKCGVTYVNFGVRTDTATDTFEAVSSLETGATGGSTGSTGISQVVEAVKEVTEQLGDTITAGLQKLKTTSTKAKSIAALSVSFLFIAAIYVGRKFGDW